MTLMMTIILMVRPAKGREDGGIGLGILGTSTD
jgi:hypothetical protein